MSSTFRTPSRGRIESTKRSASAYSASMNWTRVSPGMRLADSHWFARRASPLALRTELAQRGGQTLGTRGRGFHALARIEDGGPARFRTCLIDASELLEDPRERK